ncbi:hypothetical protein [Methylobacterium nigriterrae]|uniref:hypothetical protein n=1 Tax=Methylobacterium nigriterrae TaxID=3127512 RepID=UPI0030137468
MTADLREAFHLASVAYIEWKRRNDEQRTWGYLVDEHGKRGYDPEPTVQFFGRERLLSEICNYALAIRDDLPLHMQQLYGMVDAVGPLLPEKYSEAARELLGCIEFELREQQDAPIEKPSLVDKIRERSFREGVSAALHAVRQNLAEERKGQGGTKI